MGLLDWLRLPTTLDANTSALIERAVTVVDPMLKIVPGYEKRLAPAVRQVFDYCERLALAIPGPFSISRAAFATDPLVHALFGSADDIADMFGRSQCVRAQLSTIAIHPGHQCCALLGMRRREKLGFGARLVGDIVRVDEAQKTLSFTDHTLTEPSPDLDGIHRRLAWTMFDGLLKSLAAHVVEVRAERQQLATAHAQAPASAAVPEAHARTQSTLSERLRATADSLQPARLLEALAEHLSNPEASLRLDPVKLRVDRAGIIVAAQQDQAAADTVRFAELTSRDQRRWVVMIVRIDLEEARAAVDRFEDAKRNIVI